jgi:hypothetical protein
MGETPVRPFNPHRSAKSDAAKGLVHDIAAELRAKEKRQRAPKARDQETFLATVEPVIMDVIHLTLGAAPSAPAWLTITRSNALLGRLSSHYRAPALNGKLPNILDALHAAGWIVQRKGDRSAYALVFTDQEGEMRERRATTIKAGPRLLTAIATLGITFEDLERTRGPVIVLKQARPSRWEAAPLTSFAETAETVRLAREMESINQGLAKADIGLANGDQHHIDVTDRRLHRSFTQGDFRCGGRLAGGFWQNMPRELRLSCLLIDGEPVASIDFNSFNARALYSMARTPAPDSDLYLIAGLEEFRPGVKRFFNALLFAGGRPQMRKPRRTPEEKRAGIVLLPDDWSAERVLAALRKKHGPISRYFGTNVGHELQHTESDILVRVLLALKRRGVTALPLHDCVLVGRSKVEEAKRVMEAESKAVLGTAIPTTVERADT